MRAVIVAQFLWPLVAVPAAFCLCQPVSVTVTAVGFEPTPLRTGVWSQRLRPLGQTVLKLSQEGTEVMWPRVSLIRTSSLLRTVSCHCLKSDSCGVRTHALADWRLKPAP